MASSYNQPNPDADQTHSAAASSHEIGASAPSSSGAEPAGNGEDGTPLLYVLDRLSGEEIAGVGQPFVSELERETPSLSGRIKTLLIGKPRNLADASVFQHISLIAFFAWVGLGADGLSSSCYGPSEAFVNLGAHRFLAIPLALAIVVTVFVISTCYSYLIEDFPSGGGGYLVASKLLGKPVGVLAGCALLVDYVLTITTSIAAAGDALFGLIGPQWGEWKLTAEVAAIACLVVLNLRGVKESIQVLMPIFLLFLITHAVLIFGTIGLHLSDSQRVTHEITSQFHTALADPKLGLMGMLALLLHAYSLGAGTYTGIEAVSNSMQVMREPRVATAKKTMLYMAISLAVTAGGLILAYLLLDIRPNANKTMNLLLTEQFTHELRLNGTLMGGAFLLATLLSEGALLIVAAQAGFIGGPRGLANMAQDSWVPHWFGNLSDRLATHNGVLLMGGAALAALLYTRGDVSVLLVMYSINVFVTFSLSMLGMCRHWWQQRGTNPLWRRRLILFVFGAVLCVGILVVTVWAKLNEGAWRTLVVTGACVTVCFLINRYYRQVGAKLHKLNAMLGNLVATGEPNHAAPDPRQPTAVVLVGGYSGLGIHTMLNAVRFAPDHFHNFAFVSVAVIDSGSFKGSGAMADLKKQTAEALAKYVDLGQRLGMPSTSFMAIGTDPVDDLEALCVEVAKKFPRSTVFAGQLVFQRDSWLHRFLHNQTAYSLQRRLQWAGIPMVILPTRVR